MSLGVAALAVSAGLLIASVPAVRQTSEPLSPATEPLSLMADLDCPYANRLVISAPDRA
jgi:hypothetical protein